jgi:hypothetical protein
MSDLIHIVWLTHIKSIAERAEKQGEAAFWLLQNVGLRNGAWSSESYDHYMEYRFADPNHAFEFKMRFG